MSERLSVRVAQRAAQEIEQTAQWWRENRPAAPEALREELQHAFDLVSLRPHLGARAKNVRLEGVRRIHLARIGYHLYYLATSSAIEVLALWHVRRGTTPQL